MNSGSEREQKGVPPGHRRAKKLMAKKQEKHMSCLGILLVICMVLVMGITLSVRLMFGNGKVPKLFGTRYCYYTQSDMGSYVPSGSLVVVEDEPIKEQNVVLYQNTAGEYRIAVVSLIQQAAAENTTALYYLTTATNEVAVETTPDRILGVCTNRSAELGALIQFLTSTAGLIVGLLLPCILLLIYLISVLIAAREANAELQEEEDTDLAFVKSIQRKQQKIAERDAARRAKQREKQLISDSFEEEPVSPNKPQEDLHGIERARKMLTDEEIARLEEEEAARRAERIAAVRSHMEQRRQTETPDGVPLYTTEIITKTHTLSIPKTGDQPLTTTQRQELKPTPKENIPRLTATGHIQIPTPEQLAAEKKAEEERLTRSEELRRSAQESFAAVSGNTSETPVPQAATAQTKLVIPQDLYHTAAPAPAEEPVPKPAPKKKHKKKPQPSVPSANFNDLMAFLNDEQKKLQ